MESSKVFEKIKKVSKTQKCPTSFLKLSKLVLNMFCGNFFEKKIAPCSMQGWAFDFFPKFKKIQHSKSAQNRFQKSPNVFWTCFVAIFPIFFTQCSMQGFSDFLDLEIWAQFSGLKNKSSVFRYNTQKTFFLHSRHSQYTQSHFRFSWLKIMRSDSRT